MKIIKFNRRVDLLLENKLQYSTHARSKDDALLIKKLWLKHDSKPTVKIILLKTEVELARKHLMRITFYDNEEPIHTLWVRNIVSYYLKTFWCLEKDKKVVEMEYVHRRWPTDNFIKVVTATQYTKAIKGL